MAAESAEPRVWQGRCRTALYAPASQNIFRFRHGADTASWNSPHGIDTAVNLQPGPVFYTMNQYPTRGGGAGVRGRGGRQVGSTASRSNNNAGVEGSINVVATQLETETPTPEAVHKSSSSGQKRRRTEQVFESEEAALVSKVSPGFITSDLIDRSSKAVQNSCFWKAIPT